MKKREYPAWIEFVGEPLPSSLAQLDRFLDNSTFQDDVTDDEKFCCYGLFLTLENLKQDATYFMLVMERFCKEESARESPLFGAYVTAMQLHESDRWVCNLRSLETICRQR